MGKDALIDTFNEVRRTIAHGEQDGQPPAANMKKMVIVHIQKQHSVNNIYRAGQTSSPP